MRVLEAEGGGQLMCCSGAKPMEVEKLPGSDYWIHVIAYKDFVPVPYYSELAAEIRTNDSAFLLVLIIIPVPFSETLSPHAF
jgi:hypothetical protein